MLESQATCTFRSLTEKCIDLVQDENVAHDLDFAEKTKSIKLENANIIEFNIILKL